MFLPLFLSFSGLLTNHLPPCFIGPFSRVRILCRISPECMYSCIPEITVELYEANYHPLEGGCEERRARSLFIGATARVLAGLESISASNFSFVSWPRQQPAPNRRSIRWGSALTGVIDWLWAPRQLVSGGRSRSCCCDE